jgi:hypothetical protein
VEGFTHILAAGIIAKLASVYWAPWPWFLLLVVAFGLGLLSHAIIDPLGRITYHPPDVPRRNERGARFWLPFHMFMFSAVAVASIWLILAFGSQWWLFLMAGIGAMLPDAVDLGYRSFIKLRGKTPKGTTWSTSTEMTFHKYICWPLEQVTDRILPDLAHDPRGGVVEVAIDVFFIILLILGLRVPPIF